MNLFNMQGSWGSLSGGLYEAVVARGCQPLYQQFVEQTVPDLPEGARVVDVGCGGGHVTRILAERFGGCEVTGIDLSAAQVRRAQRRHGDLPNLAFRQGDAQDLPLQDHCVDLVTCVASIKHWPDPLAGLRQVHRVLVPGGGLCIVEVDRRATPETCRDFTARWRFVLPGTRWALAAYFRRVVAGQALDLEHLLDLLGQAGFCRPEGLQIEGHPFVAALARTPATVAF